jgi:succinoglycan biosynthesis protein ExoA
MPHDPTPEPPATSQPKSGAILAVIPCLNEETHLGRLLGQLMADPAIDRIVVADGGSTDDSRAIVRRLAESDSRIVLLDNPDRIQSAGVNRAVAAHGEGHAWLARIDAHCEYPDHYVAGLVAAAGAQDADCVVVPMVTVGEGCFQRAAAAAQNSLIGTGGSPHRQSGRGRFVDHGHHALMDIDLFIAAGGYCEAMVANEDAELDHRMGKLGGSIWLEPDLAIRYFPRRTPGALWKQYWRYGEGRARNVLRHRLTLKPRQFAPLLVPLAVACLALAPLHPIFALPALAWLGLTLGLGVVIGARAGGGCALGAGMAAAIMHLAWGAGFCREALLRRNGVAPRHGFSRDAQGDSAS